MRLSVQHGLQNAPFRRVRFSSPAQTPTRLTQKRILAPTPHAKAHSGPGTSRKTAFWLWALTEKRTLAPTAHAKAHSVPDGSRKSALYVIDTMRNALFGNVATAECAFPYSTGCRMRFSVECAFPHLRKRRPTSRKGAFWPWDLTQNRILTPAPHGKPHSGPDGPRKGAFCVRAVTKGRALYPRDGYQKPMQSWLSAA